jgi:uncharacterized coiled-coil DUF342 family protein
LEFKNIQTDLLKINKNISNLYQKKDYLNLDELRDEVDANNHKLLEFNELAKEINYLEEEIKIKHNELYEVKQAIRKLKQDEY